MTGAFVLVSRLGSWWVVTVGDIVLLVVSVWRQVIAMAAVSAVRGVGAWCGFRLAVRRP